jgi:hypothetical protein
MITFVVQDWEEQMAASEQPLSQEVASMNLIAAYRAQRQLSPREFEDAMQQDYGAPQVAPTAQWGYQGASNASSNASPPPGFPAAMYSYGAEPGWPPHCALEGGASGPGYGNYLYSNQHEVIHPLLITGCA